MRKTPDRSKLGRIYFGSRYQRAQSTIHLTHVLVQAEGEFLPWERDEQCLLPSPKIRMTNHQGFHTAHPGLIGLTYRMQCWVTDRHVDDPKAVALESLHPVWMTAFPKLHRYSPFHYSSQPILQPFSEATCNCSRITYKCLG